ncbi:C-type lectin domain family 2 member D-like [Elgaria multicarinata webbii]|uniref:C-type lectin domain family 2 member D-like n=1 Tax=Elgaria multicarinata webbii TaxID=159646 RepID=UPI002FCCEC80
MDGTRETEQDLCANLNPSPNTETPGSNNVRQSRIHRLKRGLQHYAKRGRVSFTVFLNVIVIVTLSCVILTKANCPTPPTISVDVCPADWIGYQKKCYYFANATGDLNSSKAYCLSFNASLAMIDSQKEMDFLKRHKGSHDHRIGLLRDQDKGSWKWIDGTSFDGWFEVGGGGKCAYLNDKGVTGASCRRNEPWICSKKKDILCFTKQEHEKSPVASCWIRLKACLVQRPDSHSDQPDPSGKPTKWT